MNFGIFCILLIFLVLADVAAFCIADFPYPVAAIYKWPGGGFLALFNYGRCSSDEGTASRTPSVSATGASIPDSASGVLASKINCSCGLCFMIWDKLRNGEASQIGELEDGEQEHLDAHEYCPEAPDTRKSGGVLASALEDAPCGRHTEYFACGLKFGHEEPCDMRLIGVDAIKERMEREVLASPPHICDSHCAHYCPDPPASSPQSAEDFWKEILYFKHIPELEEAAHRSKMEKWILVFAESYHQQALSGKAEQIARALMNPGESYCHRWLTEVQEIIKRELSK